MPIRTQQQHAHNLGLHPKCQIFFSDSALKKFNLHKLNYLTSLSLSLSLHFSPLTHSNNNMASAVTKSKKASATGNPPKQKAEMEHFRFSIIQMRAKGLLFKKCAKCRGFVKSVIIDPNGENDRWFCTQNCQRVISDVVFNFELKLDVVNIENGEVFHIQAYDEKCEPFIGCTPKEYYKVREKKTRKSIDEYIVSNTERTLCVVVKRRSRYYIKT